MSKTKGTRSTKLLVFEAVYIPSLTCGYELCMDGLGNHS